MDETQIQSVIQYSSSINSAFISTTDHLPCDTIRSLWLIQTCNRSIDQHKNTLNSLLLSLQNAKDDSSDKRDSIEQLLLVKRKIKVLQNESVQEAKCLYNQLITHKLTLRDEVAQLAELASSPVERETNIAGANKELREQLIEHYRKSPLLSQKEALKEQQSKKTKAIVASNRNRKHATHTNPKGVKLILRIPKKKHKLQLQEHNKAKLKKEKHKRKRATPEISSFDREETVSDNDVDTNLYCFCKQPSYGDMIACDNEDRCPNGVWFHYGCVGIKNRVDALKYATGKQKWFCSLYCKTMSEKRRRNKKK